MEQGKIIETKVLLDYDFRNQANLLKYVRRVWPFILRFDFPIWGQLKISKVQVKKTEHGWHLYLTAKNSIPDRDLVFLQLVMGSDFKREMFNHRRIRLRLMKGWNVLYKKKFDEEHKHLVSREIPLPRLSRTIYRFIRAAQRNKRLI